MAADSDGSLTAVVICEGDLHDPEFPKRLKNLLGKLKLILAQPKRKKKGIKVNKVEPWNSVRVTLSIPKDAAVKLRQLAAEGSAALRALGILSVQLEGDSVISLRLAGQEIVLRTDNQACSTPSTGGLGDLANMIAQSHQHLVTPQIEVTQLASCPDVPSRSSFDVLGNGNSDLAMAGPSSRTPIQLPNGPSHHQDVTKPMFKSPNMVCPMDGKIPTTVPPNLNDGPPYPFESMTQARVIHRRENTMGMTSIGTTGPSSGSPVVVNQFVTPSVQPVPPPPPPYPSGSAASKPFPHTSASVVPTAGNIAISSPLLVNLLQNEGNINSPNSSNMQQPQPQHQQNKSHGIHMKNGQEIVIIGTGNPPTQVSGLPDEHLTNKNSVVTNAIMPQTIQTMAHPMSLGGASRHHPVVLQSQTSLPNMGNSNSSNMTATTVPSQSSNLKIQSRCSQNQPLQKLQPNQQSHGRVNVQQTFAQQAPPNQLQKHQVLAQQQHQQAQATFNTQVPQFSATTQQPAQHMNLPPHLNSAVHLNRSASMPGQSSHLVNMLSNQLQHPQQQLQQQQILGMQQSVQQNPQTHQNITDQPQTQIQNQHQPLHQSTYNPRWPLKPMDSATKDSFQEFTRYQMEYNFIQSQQHSAKDHDQMLNDLDELTKNDLESLLPNLNDGDLDTALSVIDKATPLHSLLEHKDLVDLIDTSSSAVAASSTLKVASGQPKTDRKKERQFLINPLTGDLEPIPSEDSADEIDLPAFSEFHSEMSNSMYSDDDNSSSTAFSKTTSEPSDNERSSNSEHSSSKSSRSKAKERNDSAGSSSKRKTTSKDKSLAKHVLAKDSSKIKEKLLGKPSRSSSKDKASKFKMGDSPLGDASPAHQEKIKLRLKLEKSEPVSPAYKVDVSFVPSPKRAQSSSIQAKIINSASSSPSSSSSSSTATATSSGSVYNQPQSAQSSPVQAGGGGEELRVPPLHISLRGRNSVVIKNSKKDRKKSQSGGEEDESKKRLNVESDSNHISAFEMAYRFPCNNYRPKPATAVINNVQQQRRSEDDDSKMLMVGYVKTVHENGSPHDMLAKDLNAVKRSASEVLIQSPNGTACPEKKRRLSHNLVTVAPTSEAQAPGSSSTPPQREYQGLNGPIGSTNVGTLPQHASLSSNKNQKGNNNNNNNPPFNKLLKSVAKLKRKSPVAVKKDSTHPNPSKPMKTLVVMPKGSMDAISGEKFKQKLLEPPSNWPPTSSAPSYHSKPPPTSTNTDIIPVSSTSTTTSALSSSSPTYNSTTLSDPTTTTATSESQTSSKSISYPHSIHSYSNRPPSEATDSPKRGPDSSGETPNTTPQQGVRESPGSQAQGEDSGIESMDALSEKSPHQSSSPLATEAKRADSPPQVSNPSAEDKKATTPNLPPPPSALTTTTKTTVITVDDFNNISDIEAALAKMEGINDHRSTTTCDNAPSLTNKLLNGDHNILQDGITSNDNSVSLTKTSHDDSKPFVQRSIETPDSKMNIISIHKCPVELDRTDLVAQQELIDQLKEEEETEEKIATIIGVDKINNHYHRNHTSTVLKSAAEVAQDAQDDNEVLAQLSIEIPPGDSGLRIRTRAASKLESPLDSHQKPSPSGDASVVLLMSSASPTTVNTSGGSGSKSTKLSLERLSPKIVGRTIKRKRHGSESSTQSCVSDDTPLSTSGSIRKKPRKTTIENVTISITTSSTASASTTVVTTTTTVAGSASHHVTGTTGTANKSSSAPPNLSNQKKVQNEPPKHNTSKAVGTPATTPTPPDKKTSTSPAPEESSDSDEPLIEIAGKVRNKLQKSHEVVDKVLRNHKTGTPTSKPHPSVSAGKNAKASTVTTNSTTPAASSSLDDKTSPIMSTRRSVRMTMNAAAHSKDETTTTIRKGVGTAIGAGPAAVTAHHHNSSSAGANKSTSSLGGAAGAADIIGDARRKTRSAAVLNESASLSVTERRRRRGSPDARK